MFVLPLGLGTKLRRPPLVTLAFASLWVAAFLIETPTSQVTNGLLTAVAKSGLRDASRRLFVEYCLSRGGKAKDCADYSILVWPGFPAQLRGEIRSNAYPLVKRMNFPAMLAESKRADALKNKLEDCSGSRRCFLYKDILWKFLDSGRARGDGIRRLAGYQSYASALNSYRKNLLRVCASERCLVKGNINPASLALAQLRHGGFMHLFSNLFAFVLFGIYVEQRSNRVVYASTIVLGGTIGMAFHAFFFGTGDTIALGGSANVSAVMGMFLVYFYRCRMAFLVWLPRKAYLGSRFFADVRYSFPLLFVLSDVAGGLDSGFASIATGRVAHFAHLAGLAVGVLVALAVTSLRRLPRPFIYEGEVDDMLALEKSRDMAQIIQRAGDMVSVNPENVHAMEAAVGNFLRWAQIGEGERNAPLFHLGRGFVVEHLSTICAVNCERGELRYATKLLSQVPLYMPYPFYLGRLGQVHALKLGDFALSQGHPLLALRLYDLFLTQFRKSLKTPSVFATATNLLGTLPPSSENVRSLKTYLTYHPESLLVGPIEAYLTGAAEREKSA